MLPLEINMYVRAEVEIAEGLFKLLESCGGVYRPGNPIVSCKIYSDKQYAFVELRSIEETSNCMALDGARFRGNFLKVRVNDCIFAFIFVYV